MIDFFTGFYAIRKGWMRLRIRKVHRIGLASDQADESLIGLKYGLVDRFAFEAFGGV